MLKSFKCSEAFFCSNRNHAEVSFFIVEFFGLRSCAQLAFYYFHFNPSQESRETLDAFEYPQKLFLVSSHHC